MPLEGWIKLWRKIQKSHRVWKNHEPFTKRDAWIDILLNVVYEETKISVGYQNLRLSPGQWLISYRFLANRWRWSKDKVAKFLRWLSVGEEPELKLTPLPRLKRTLLTVIKWETYQGEQDSNGDSKKDSGKTVARQWQDKDKEVKELKELKKPAPSAVELSTNVEKSKPKAQKRVEGFINNFGKVPRRDKVFTDDIKKIVVRFIERCREWGFIIEDEREAINKEFGWIQNLVEYGCPKKPSGKVRAFFTEPEKALELLNRIKGKPEDPRGSFISAIKQQPKYLG